MSNGLYDTARDNFLNGTMSWTGITTVTVALIDKTKYSATLTSDQYYSTVSAISGAVIASATLTGRTSAAGVADASDVTFSAVTGSAVGAILIYENTGTDSTSRLIAWIDTSAGLPITPNGSDILIQWDSGSNKIFKL
jgi:hypothetical protein